MSYVLLAAGLVILLVGGEFLVRGAVAVARRLGVSPLMIGLTLVGFGTSTPELVACVDAALAGAPGLAIGNVVGSNIANILLILGVGAAIAPIATTRAAFVRDGPILLVATVLLIAACAAGTIGRPVGALLLALLVAYTLWTYWTDRSHGNAGAALHEAEAESLGPLPASLAAGLALGVGGLIGVLAGAAMLVDGAIDVARIWGISETVIGLTVVAVGTSLPELATAVAASLRRQGDVAFGNVVGSNIFNALGIVGTTALVQPLAVPSEIMAFDVWVMLGVTVFGVAFALTGWRVTRLEGLALLAAYAAYLTFTLA